MSSVIDGVNQRTQLVGRNRLELLLFRMGSQQRFGLNVFKVREVIKCPPLTRMPNAHPVVRGLASIRDLTITVLDLAAAIGLAPTSDPTGQFVIVAEYNRRILGFLVSGVDRIVNLNWESIKAPPSGIGRVNYLTAITNVDDELIEVVDVEKVLAEVIGLKLDIDVADGMRDLGTEEPRKVLFVDDSAMARKQIRRVLEQVGVPWEMATNGRDALQLLDQMVEDGSSLDEHLSMIICDIEMPEMDGYTLTKRLKEHPQMKNMFICLHTSLSGSFNEAMARKVGADYLLSKFDPDELANLVIDKVGRTVENAA